MCFYGQNGNSLFYVEILHVEQEVTGDDTLALQSVLESDEKREGLLREEKEINEKLNNQ